MVVGTGRAWGVGRIAVAGVAVSIALGCGGGGSSPSSGTPPVAATATPAPATPTPVTSSGCKLPAPPKGSQCRGESPTYLTEVEAAIDLLVAQKPGVFDLSDQRGGGGYRIASPGQFYTGLIANLEATGLCAAYDGEELQVKKSNEFSDQYDVELSTGHVRRGPTAYRVTCYPAAFPEAVLASPGPVAGCTIGGSRSIACGRETPRYLSDVEAAITQLSNSKPELFDKGDMQPGTDFYKVTNIAGYTAGVVQALTARGFCAFWDGEEIQVKRENGFSDHYDILTSDDHIRKGTGAYRSTCYPAAF
jgi:hypothetical protein